VKLNPDVVAAFVDAALGVAVGNRNVKLVDGSVDLGNGIGRVTLTDTSSENEGIDGDNDIDDACDSEGRAAIVDGTPIVVGKMKVDPPAALDLGTVLVALDDETG